MWSRRRRNRVEVGEVGEAGGGTDGGESQNSYRRVRVQQGNKGVNEA